jgi:serine/threonine protein kinase
VRKPPTIGSGVWRWLDPRSGSALPHTGIGRPILTDAAARNSYDNPSGGVRCLHHRNPSPGFGLANCTIIIEDRAMIEPNRAPGTKVGRYNILRSLPWGGLSRVYLAMDRPGQQVALRILPLNNGADTLEQAESLRQGAVLQSYLSLIDPRVDRPAAIGEADGYFFTAMEYHEGGTLSQMVRQGPLPVRRAAYIAAEVCDIIRRAHALKFTIGDLSVVGIVHGDIKPTNIYLTYDTSHRVSLVSFDIAKALLASTSLPGNNFGSYGYMSPERLKALAVNRLSDLWSLAVTLFEITTGTKPYVTTNEKGEEVGPRSPMTPVPESCPAALASILRKALDLETAKRFQTAAELQASLLAFIGGFSENEAKSLKHEVKQMLVSPRYYSCFISYSTRDQALAERLYVDLTGAGVSCWYAPHSARGGRKLYEQIDAAIREHNRLLLILSNDSMSSQWVQTEIISTRLREVREQRQILFPIRIVSFDTLRRWQCFDADSGRDAAREIREYYIPDFMRWTDKTSYQHAFENLLADLRTEQSQPSPPTIQHV